MSAVVAPSTDSLQERAAPGVTTATMLIATYNRAAFLKDTLESIAGLRTPAGVVWEVVVVDNNSTDETRAVVERAVASFPVPLSYVFESRQGKSLALVKIKCFIIVEPQSFLHQGPADSP